MLNPKGKSIDELKKEYLAQGYYEEWSEFFAKRDFNAQIPNIPFTMPDRIEGGHQYLVPGVGTCTFTGD